jgi:hypothetical protein
MRVRSPSTATRCASPAPHPPLTCLICYHSKMRSLPFTLRLDEVAMWLRPSAEAFREQHGTSVVWTVDWFRIESDGEYYFDDHTLRALGSQALHVRHSQSRYEEVTVRAFRHAFEMLSLTKEGKSQLVETIFPVCMKGSSQ